MYIDCHVHCRDEEQNGKEKIENVLSVAKDSRLSAMFDMPNTKRPVISRKRVLERFALAYGADSPVFYGVYIGVTSNKDQVREAVETYKEFFPKPDSRIGVIGLKMFAGKSVGDLEIIEPEQQREVYNQLEKLGYKGVLAVHCEKESEMRPELWDSSKPWTHGYARPEHAEIASIIDQTTFVLETKYQGRLHICHVSTPESVNIVRYANKVSRTSCGVTPHHLLLSSEMMKGENGILYKVNPPLRDESTRRGLLSEFKRGKIDVLESDHAPHTEKDKLQRHMSGLPGVASWPDVIQILKRRGVDDDLMRKVAFDNVNEIFGTQIRQLNFPIKDRTGDYVFDPYAHLK